MAIVDFMTLATVLKTYMSEEEIEDIHKTFLFASKAHESQLRKSGEPYIIHPLDVAIILASQKTPKDVVIAGLLHDVVEDTEYTYEDIVENFSQEIANIVEGVTKLGQIEGYSYDQLQAENHRKIILASAKDIRVIVVKLADRLHNMRTIKFMNSEKQKLISKETLEVYAPISHRLGMYEMKWELEDLSFRCLNPEKYHEIASKLEMKKSEREIIVEETLETVTNILEEEHLNARIKGRSKHIYSIYKKLNQGKHFEDILDLFAFRIIVDSITDCYKALGIIHKNFKPIPMKFKDYIPTPKHNMYQSIHTTVLTKKGFPMEFQIRTEKMNVEAEYGIASHWIYKENKDSKELQEEINQKLTWLRRILEEGDLVEDSEQFMNKVKDDYLSKSILIFTPSGDSIELPNDSTALDFAFYVHTDIALHALSAKVNDKFVSLFYKLEVGDVVNIITSDYAEPSISWMAKVKTSRAKESLKKYFNHAETKKIQDEGQKIFLDLELSYPNINFKEIFETEKLDNLIYKLNYARREEFLYDLGIGEIDVEDIIKIIKKKDIEPSEEKNMAIVSDVSHPYLTKMCKLCSPLPGDRIKATKKKTSGINQYYIHRYECNQPHSKYEAEFTSQAQEHEFICRLIINFKDEKKKLGEVITAVSSLGYNLASVYARRSLEGQGVCKLSIELNTKKDFTRIKKELLDIPEIISVERAIVSNDELEQNEKTR